MKQFTRNSIGLVVGLALVAPWGLADAPSSVGGSLSGFSANAQGGQSAGDWGIPQSSAGQNGPGQASNQSGGGQNSAGQGKGPDAGGYGNGQNTQSGNGQNNQSGNGQNVNSQGKGPDAGGYGDGQNTQSGNGQNVNSQGKGPDAGGYGDGQNGQNNQNGSGQNGAGQQNSNNGSGQGEHSNDGPTKNNSNNPDGDGSGHGEHYDDGPTKNNSNNPDGGDHSGSAEGEGPTKNNSNNPDGGEHGNSGGNNNGNGSGSGSGSSGGRGNDGGDFPPLDPGNDGQYDPGENGGDQQIPSNCAEANSECGQCVQRNEAKLQFNRRYLHVAWSMTHQTLEYTKQAIAFGDGVSEMSKSSLSWQLTGKPQIIEAAQSMRRTYANKYQIYIHNMEEAMNEMTACEADNYSVQSLYRQFSGLYLDFVKARYQSPE